MTTLLLPPLALLLLCLVLALAAARGSRRAGLGAALAAFVLLLLATPAVAGLLRWSLEREVTTPALASPPAAIIVLGGDVARGVGGPTIGALTLQRLRAGAALQRRTGLPLLVTGGVLSPGDPALASLMASSLAEDFATPARWVEPLAADTRGNARFSTMMLQAQGINSAFLVTHAWHLPRAMAAFARAGLVVTPAPVLPRAAPSFAWRDWRPAPEQWGASWLALREWAGRVVYALRD